MTRELQKGTKLKNGKYTIERLIHKGFFGILYKGTLHVLARGTQGEIETTQAVAIKEFYFANICKRHSDGKTLLIISPSKRQLTQTAKEKFLKQAHTLARLKHPHIVKVLEIFEENNTAYMVMQYIEGHPLAVCVKRGLSVKDSVSIISQVLRALDFVHQHHILHLDVKPQNILCTQEGKAILMGFGIAKQYSKEGKLGRHSDYCPKCRIFTP